MATPTKINRRGLSPDFQERVYTRKQATAPPTKANKGDQKNKVGNRLKANIVVNAAPAETPIIPASAKGFLITACNNTPETAKAAPVNNETMILGKRRSLITSTF